MTWYRDLPLRWKLLGAFGLLLLLTTGLNALAFRGVAVAADSAAQVRETQQVLGLADEALISLVDMETGLRGFLLSGEESFLEPYTGGQTTFEDKFAALEAATANRPEQTRRWRDVQRMAEAWVRDVAEPAIRLRREVSSGQRPSSDLTALILAGAGKPQFDSLRRQFDQARTTEEALLTQRELESREANERLRQVLVGGTAALVGLGLVIAVFISHDLSAVSERLQAATERIAAGEFAYRVGLRRRDELGRTAAAFDRMAGQLGSTDAERRAAEGALRAANGELEQFAYTVSHDLKAPLVTIQGFANRLTRDYGEVLGETGRRYLGRIEANASHLGVLIEIVLAFSRVGRVGAPPAAVDLRDAVDQVLEGLQDPIERRGATVRVQHPLPVVEASPTLINQILTNLLANALAYGAAPGAAPEIEVACDDRGDHWRLSVSDHGPGIAPEQQDRLFRLFERLPAGMAANPAGTGVGLATVRKAAQAMGGSAGVRSEVDEGATFWVDFPKPAGTFPAPGGGAIESEATARGGAPPALVRS
jgi:signal transduction histidine kinase